MHGLYQSCCCAPQSPKLCFIVHSLNRALVPSMLSGDHMLEYCMSPLTPNVNTHAQARISDTGTTWLHCTGVIPTFFHGRFMRGCPSAMLVRSTRSRWLASLWRKTLTLAPDARAPDTMDAWFSWSLMIRHPYRLCTRMQDMHGLSWLWYPWNTACFAMACPRCTTSLPACPPNTRASSACQTVHKEHMAHPPSKMQRAHTALHEMVLFEMGARSR